MKQINNNLSDEQKRVLFDKGTEAPHTDQNLTDFSDGMYSCVNCGAELFSSSAKYESTEPGLIGWPSFDKALKGAVTEKDDSSLGMQRTEIVCTKCEGHLGHVFAADDAPSGTHYCLNSVSLDFKKSDK